MRIPSDGPERTDCSTKLAEKQNTSPVVGEGLVSLASVKGVDRIRLLVGGGVPVAIQAIDGPRGIYAELTIAEAKELLQDLFDVIETAEGR